MRGGVAAMPEPARAQWDRPSISETGLRCENCQSRGPARSTRLASNYLRRRVRSVASMWGKRPHFASLFREHWRIPFRALRSLAVRGPPHRSGPRRWTAEAPSRTLAALTPRGGGLRPSLTACGAHGQVPARHRRSGRRSGSNQLEDLTPQSGPLLARIPGSLLASVEALADRTIRASSPTRAAAASAQAPGG
jgi:hypothetical protein